MALELIPISSRWVGNLVRGPERDLVRCSGLEGSLSASDELSDRNAVGPDRERIRHGRRPHRTGPPRAAARRRPDAERYRRLLVEPRPQVPQAPVVPNLEA